MAKKKKKKKERSLWERLAPRHEFLVKADESWSGYMTECLLRRYGILIKGRNVLPGNDDLPPLIRFTVQRWRANQAEYIMLRAGVPVFSLLFNPANEKQRRLPGEGSISPGGWGHGRLDFVTHFIDFITPLVGFRVGDYGHDLPVEKRQRNTTGLANFNKERKHAGRKHAVARR